MLVLSRNEDERVFITVPASSDETVIEVCVVRILPDKVKLGFDAPGDSRIERKEVRDRRLAGEPAPVRAGR